VHGGLDRDLRAGRAERKKERERERERRRQWKGREGEKKKDGERRLGGPEAVLDALDSLLVGQERC
jgi:hypothetical protein